MELVIHDISSDGEGIGKKDGLVYFVQGALPGDIVKIKPLKIKKNYAIGKLLSVTKPSQFRTKSVCDSTDYCGGCQLQNYDYKEQVNLKTNIVKNTLKRIGGIKENIIVETIGMENPHRYRNKGQFAFSYDNGEIILGHKKPKSHEVKDITSCTLQPKSIERVLSISKSFVAANKLQPYNPTTRKGLLRHLVTRISYTRKEIMVILVITQDNLPFKEKYIKLLTKEIPDVKSIVINKNNKKTGEVLGDKTETIYGKNKITENIGGLVFNISPVSFYQINPIQTKVLYDKVLDFAQLTGKETVVDLYCGTGTIGLYLAKKAKKVFGIEINQDAVNDAIENAKLNKITNAEFIKSPSEWLSSFVKYKNIKPDIIILDPPRKGCEKNLIEDIEKINPLRIVYISCNPATLARDLNLFEKLRYKVKKVQPIDMFPHTTHVETVVLMSRVKVNTMF